MRRPFRSTIRPFANRFIDVAACVAAGCMRVACTHTLSFFFFFNFLVLYIAAYKTIIQLLRSSITHAHRWRSLPARTLSLSALPQLLLLLAPALAACAGRRISINSSSVTGLPPWHSLPLSLTLSASGHLQLTLLRTCHSRLQLNQPSSWLWQLARQLHTTWQKAFSFG